MYRVHPDGTGLEQLTDNPAFDDQATLSPDGKQLAFVSTREQRTANIWLLDLKTQKLRNLTTQTGIAGEPGRPTSLLGPRGRPTGSGWPLLLTAIPNGRAMGTVRAGNTCRNSAFT